jgi:predicted enzyme related to lactoylglutathione lyase
MSARSRSKSFITLGLVLNLLFFTQAYAEQDSHPSIAGLVPFFYYSDLKEAADWYENTFGFKKLTDEGWVVIFETTDTSYIGMVNATGGTLKPTEDKGVLLSIETAELEAWYEKLSATEGSNIIQGIKNNDNGLIEEFRLVDPGGYIIEFFRWHDHRVESERYAD